MISRDPKRRVWETVTYTDNPDLPGPEEMVEIARDFLPRPEELVFKKPTRKVTIVLEEESIDFFETEAKRLNLSYQDMIRALLQAYVQRAR